MFSRVNRSLLLPITLSVVGCSTADVSVISPAPPSHDLIVLLDYTFEANGIPTLAGWTVRDSSLVHFSDDVPPGGGSFSLVILGRNRETNFVTWSTEAAGGINYLRLSWWAKHTRIATPRATIGLRHGETVEVAHSFAMAEDSSWVSYSVLDTLIAGPGDSLWIKIDSGGNDFSEGTTLYDLVTLKRYR